MKILPINELSIDDTLGNDLHDSEGNLIARRGVRISAPIRGKLEEMRIGAVHIEEKRQSANGKAEFDKEHYDKTVKDIDLYFKKSAGNDYSQAPKWQPLNAEALANAVQMLSEATEYMAEKYDSFQDPMAYLSYMKDFDHYTYIHNVNVAVLSALLGSIVDLDPESLFKLVIGALFHDLGKLTVPLTILLKQERLTDSDWNYIKGHPRDGLVMLRESNIPAVSKTIILQHHERFDGQGYPRGKSGKEIHLLSRVATLADVYDALTSARPYRKAFTPNEVIEYFLGGCGTHFDYELVKEFSNKIAPYPIGTVVKLSNGLKAIVTSVNEIYPRLPMVKITVRAGSEKEEKVIDLQTKRNITIIDVVKEKIKEKLSPPSSSESGLDSKLSIQN